MSLKILFLAVIVALVSFSGTSAQKADVVLKEGKYLIRMQNQAMEIDPSVGGRVTFLKIGNQNFLTDSTVNNFNWGSTFWLSPQSDWNWPPSAEIDNKLYRTSLSDNVLKMISQKDLKTGLVITKEIWGEAGNGSFTLKFTITNDSEKIRKVAPWEVTRVKPGGLSFFPIGKDIARGGLLASTFVKNGIFYYQYQKEKLPEKGDRQIYSDGSEGWLAQLNDDLILIKKFPDVPPEQTAPNEGEVELFASEVSEQNPGYVEIEHQGPFLELKPGQSSVWETTWFLRKLPSGIKPEAGNPALVEFVRNIVK